MFLHIRSNIRYFNNSSRTGINEGTKVRFLLAGIKTEKLNTIKGQVLRDLTLQTNFIAASTCSKPSLSKLAMIAHKLPMF